MFIKYFDLSWTLSSQLNDEELANTTSLCSLVQMDHKKQRLISFLCLFIMTTDQKMLQQEAIWKSCLYGNAIWSAIIWWCGGNSKAKKDSEVSTFLGDISITYHWFLTGGTKAKERWPHLGSRSISGSSMSILLILWTFFSDSGSSEVELISYTGSVAPHVLG